jgi:hypothetical protein
MAYATSLIKKVAATIMVSPTQRCSSHVNNAPEPLTVSPIPEFFFLFSKHVRTHDYINPSRNPSHRIILVINRVNKHILEWTEAGGIIGRGVLLDFALWAQTHGITYDPASTYKITADALEKVAAWEGVKFMAGDILVVRTGWLGWHDQTDEDTRIRLTRDKHENVGMAASEETAAWIWYV